MKARLKRNSRKSDLPRILRQVDPKHSGFLRTSRKFRHCAFIVIILILAISLLSSCSGRQNENESTYYTCPMHPQIHEDEPGDCPICGMPLVLKTDSVSSTALSHSDTSLPVDKQKILSSLPAIHPVKKARQEKITADGTIEYDTRQERKIATRFSGRIEKLYVKYMYQPVKRGEVLMEIYSPEMVTEQQNLIFLLNDSSSDQQLISVSKRKLMLLGMTENQIDQVIKTKEPLSRISVYSPYEGHIHEATARNGIARNGTAMNGKAMKSTVMNGTADESQMNPSNMDELSLKEGMYVQKGQTVFNLLDPHMVLAVLKIYPDDAAKIKLHLPVELTVEGTGKKLPGQIDFIEPFYEPNSKTLSARVYLDNEDHTLKVGMYLRAAISADSIFGIWIPKKAMLDLGRRKIVFLKNEHVFQPHEIKTGNASGDFIRVIEGLDESDEIASDAQYIEDSESFITIK